MSSFSKKIKIFLFFLIALEFFLKFPLKTECINFDFDLPQLIIREGNTVVSLPNSKNFQPRVIKKMKVIVTAYTSNVWETDENPFLTAAGTNTRDGVVANNLLPLGTKIKIPEIFGDKIFIVEDRMNPKKGKYQIDVWFDDYQKAKEFGAKTTYVEILES